MRRCTVSFAWVTARSRMSLSTSLRMRKVSVLPSAERWSWQLAEEALQEVVVDLRRVGRRR